MKIRFTKIRQTHLAWLEKVVWWFLNRKLICMYVQFLNLRSIKNIFRIFQNGGFFPIAYFFQAKQRFFKYQLILSPDFKKLFFSSESSSDKDAKRCKYLFYSSSGSGDIREKHKFRNQVDVYICYSLYIQFIHVAKWFGISKRKSKSSFGMTIFFFHIIYII